MLDHTVIKPLQKSVIKEKISSSTTVLHSPGPYADNQSDTPVLNDLQSWPELWSDVLGTDFAGVEFPTQFDSLEITDWSVFNSADGTDSWAAQSLLPVPQRSSPEAASTSQYCFTPVQVPTPPPEQVCYGMVSD